MALSLATCRLMYYTEQVAMASTDKKLSVLVSLFWTVSVLLLDWLEKPSLLTILLVTVSGEVFCCVSWTRMVESSKSPSSSILREKYMCINIVDSIFYVCSEVGCLL